MKIQVNFYKETGKYYSGGVVDIGDTPAWDTDAVKQAIVDNQGILMDGWQNGGSYYVVIGNVSDDDDFCMRHFGVNDFRGMVRR